LQGKDFQSMYIPTGEYLSILVSGKDSKRIAVVPRF
jgi:hypothetical protein